MESDAAHSRITRRRLLELAISVPAALGLAACARRADTPADSTPSAPAVTTPASAVSAPAPTTPPTAAAASTLSPASAAKTGGSITAAVQNDWVTFDNIYNSAEGTSHYMIYDPLFFFAPDSSGKWTAQPGLVEQSEFSGNSGTLHLRQGVKFHDGSDWNADVLEWNFQRMLSDPKSIAKGVLNGVDPSNPITKLDDHTVRINLTQPSPSLPEQLTSSLTFPISRAAFEKLGADQYARNPVGTGPFKFAEWKPSERIVLQRNENYWLKDSAGKQLPYLDGITYRLIIDDSVRLLELKAGNIDFTELIQGKDLPSVQSADSLNLVDGPWCGNAYRLIFNSKGGPFATNLKLRQAALYAIDREAIAQALGQGVGTASKFLLLPGSLGYDESLPYYWYDADKAKSLMNEAGFSSGLDVTFTVISREVDQLQAQIIKQMWEKIGIRAELDVLERAAWTQRLVTGGGDFHVGSMRNPSSAGDADPPLRTFLWTKGSFNVAHLSNPEMDAALDKGSGTYDTAQREIAYHDLQKLDFDLAYYGYIWMQRWNWAFTKRVVGFPPVMTNAWNFRAVSVTG
ncbi:MAG: ABC transporter substrate-binding protein [Chloroflexota bacterium]|nr:ABC transporter substrate-binding protein [Chloroflexota bacterium]